MQLCCDKLDLSLRLAIWVGSAKPCTEKACYAKKQSGNVAEDREIDPMSKNKESSHPPWKSVIVISRHIS